MALRNPHIQRQVEEVRRALASMTSWHAKGAMVVAALGMVALLILAVSRPEPVATTSAMESGYADSDSTEAEPKNASAPIASASTVAAAAGNDSPVVTLTGCLEQDDNVFRLRDADGLNAPKARSWKSGFLKKKSAKVDVVDASNRLRLRNHVGRRVSVTGVLYEREILAGSVKRVSASCK